MRLSVVIPVYNERDNLRLLYDALLQGLSPIGETYEIIFVNDGSRDGTADVLASLAAADPAVKVIHFRRNYGQTAAMSAGIQFASGEVIVTMDGDLQNDPADLAMMLAKLEEGYDLVHGWRKHRQDTFLNRKLPSKIANWLISNVTGFPVHDLGCTLKVIRREIAQELRMYGEMHRFIPILAHWHGARCVEVETRHHARRFGATKYGIWRTVRVILDLLTVKFMIHYSVSPMKLFGGVGLCCAAASLLAGAATVAMKLFGGVDMTGNPCLLFAGLSGIASIQFLVLGLLGEVSSRIYYESQDKRPYSIRQLINFAPQPAEDGEDHVRFRAA